MIVAATAWEIAAQHVVSFALGLGLGFVLSGRYRIVKRDGADH